MFPVTWGTLAEGRGSTLRGREETFGIGCQGAVRTMSRTAAAKRIKGGDLAAQLEERGISVRTDSLRGLAEEAPFAYKNVCDVVDVCHDAGIARKVARMSPLGVLKG